MGYTPHIDGYHPPASRVPVTPFAQVGPLPLSLLSLPPSALSLPPLAPRVWGSGESTPTWMATTRPPVPVIQGGSAVEKTRHIMDSQGQILAVAFR